MPPFARARPICPVYNFWDRHHWVLDAHGKTPGEHWTGIKNAIELRSSIVIGQRSWRAVGPMMTSAIYTLLQ